MTENNELINVKTSDGKYRIIQSSNGEVSLYRNDEYWRDATGEKCILQLAYDIDALRKENEELKNQLDEMSRIDEKYDE